MQHDLGFIPSPEKKDKSMDNMNMDHTKMQHQMPQHKDGA